MELKILNIKELNEAKLPVIPPFTDDERIAWAQAKVTVEQVRKLIAVVEMPKGLEAGYSVDGKPFVALAMSVEDWQAFNEIIDRQGGK